MKRLPQKNCGSLELYRVLSVDSAYPAEAVLYAAHLNAREGIVELLSYRTHLLHACGEADLLAMVVDLADR